MKICGMCKTEKPLDQFHKRAKAKDGRQGRCRECSISERTKLYNTVEGKKSTRKHSNDSKERNRKFVWDHLRENPCVDCGEDDIVVLEFDHVLDTKKMDISTMHRGGHSIENLKEEISKCEVRCANCHRRKTATQFNWKITQQDMGG